MLLFRMGPRYLFVRSEKIDEIVNHLVENLKGEITEFQQGFERATENSTLCFVTGINHEKTYVEDAKEIVLINDVASVILSSIINSNACSLVHKVDMGPSSIVMRIAGDEHKLIEKLKVTFSGKEVDWIEGIGAGEKDDTLLAFTNKELSGPVADFSDTKLLIPQPSSEVRNRLRLEGLRFITQSLDDSQWYELRINIYDANGKYQENYNRLMYILTKLEIGMVLGESWTKDFAVMLYSVMTYQIRLFTFIEPYEVKKILMALEYTIDGQRMVDFDLYYKNKKVYWYDITKAKSRKRNKLEDVKGYKHSLYEKLKPEEINILEDMERSILQD